jgi:hypothetical protein
MSWLRPFPDKTNEKSSRRTVSLTLYFLSPVNLMNVLQLTDHWHRPIDVFFSIHSPALLVTNRCCRIEEMGGGDWGRGVNEYHKKPPKSHL